MDEKIPCAAGRDLCNPRYEDWTQPCPNEGRHPLLLDIEAFFFLCDDHAESMDRIMEGQEGYGKMPLGES